MAGLSGINHLKQGRAYLGSGKGALNEAQKRREEHWQRREKGRCWGKNKIKEENRWQFFTSFLKRGLGTRGASLNRFFQRGERAHFSAVFLCQTAQTVPTSSCFAAEHGCRSKAEFRLESEISIPRSAIPFFLLSSKYSRSFVGAEVVHLHEPRINQDAKSEWRFLAARETDTKRSMLQKERFYLCNFYGLRFLIRMRYREMIKYEMIRYCEREQNRPEEY